MKYSEILKYADLIEDHIAGKIDIDDFDQYFPEVIKRLYRRHVNAKLPEESNKQYEKPIISNKYRELPKEANLLREIIQKTSDQHVKVINEALQYCINKIGMTLEGIRDSDHFTVEEHRGHVSTINNYYYKKQLLMRTESIFEGSKAKFNITTYV